jgi:hypothetical protein
MAIYLKQGGLVYIARWLLLVTNFLENAVNANFGEFPFHALR